MRKLILLAVLLISSAVALGKAAEKIDQSGVAGWKEMEQDPRAKGMLDFHFTAWNWAREGYRSYSTPFALTLKITNGSDMERFCEEFSWLSDQQSCPPEVSISGKIHFTKSYEPLEGGGIWRDGSLVGWMDCAKDNSSCTLNLKGRKYGAEEFFSGDNSWFEIKITYNADRSIKFISGAIYPVWGADEYFLVWYSKNLTDS